MAIVINNMNMRYKNDELDKVQIFYRIKVEDENLSGSGKFDIEPSEFDKGTEHIISLSENHLIDKIDLSNVQIMEVDVNNDDGGETHVKDDEPVIVIFNAKTKNRDLKVTGNFALSIDEYEDNKDIKSLTNRAVEYVKEHAFYI